MTISAVLEPHPELMPLFFSHGLGQFENREILRTLGPLLKLKSALTTAGVNMDAFVRLLNDTISAEACEKASSLSDDLSIQKDLTMVALMPCGMKMPFTRAFERFAENFGRENESELTYLIEGNVNHELTYYDYIEEVRDLDELPDIILCSDINSFFHKGFAERFIETGCFIDVSPSNFNADYEGTGYADPGGAYSMISSNLLVIVVDLRCLSDAPMPETWADLLLPGFENKVVMRGQDGFFCNGMLLPILRMHGMDGIRRLGRSVCSGMHPAEMVKKLSAKREEGGPAAYIMPYFFAKKITRTDHTRIIWPKEGALISPVLMLVKRERVMPFVPSWILLPEKSWGRSAPTHSSLRFIHR